MTLYHLNKLEIEHKRISAPLCVVGGGIAGLLLARQVAQSGRRVIVLESGTLSFDADIHELNEVEDPLGRYSRSLDGRYRGLGGTSSRWGGRMIPISSHEAAARSYIGQAAWPVDPQTFDDYREAAEKLFEVQPGSYDDDVLDVIDRQSYLPRNDPDLVARWAKCPSFKNCNIATILEGEIRTRENIEIWLGATVCDFELDRERGKLVSVSARDFGGRRLAVQADEFVIAAGTIESTRLLLLIDAISDQQAFSRCRVLGRYFQDHLKSEVATIGRRDPILTNRLFGYRFLNATRRDLHLELSEEAQREDRVASAFAYVSMDLADSPLADVKNITQSVQRGQIDLGEVWRVARRFGLVAKSAWWRYVHQQLFVPHDIGLRLLVCAEQLPHWSNRIRLSHERDRLGMQKAQLEWKPTEMDERTFRSAVSRIAAYWARAGFDYLCPLEWSPASRDTQTLITDCAEACAHPSGSTRMGTDPANSVVGPDLRCHAIPNVSVASASVFPTAGSANPTFTIMMLALSLADSLLHRAPSRHREFFPAVAMEESLSTIGNVAGQDLLPKSQPL